MWYNELQGKWLGVSVRNEHGEHVCDDTHAIEAPLDWQLSGLQQTATGYGAKLTTSKKVWFNGRYYRLYATCYGNAASTWFTAKNVKYWVN